MRNIAAVIGCLLALGGVGAAQAAPTVESAKLPKSELQMAPDDAIQDRPFVLEAEGGYWHYRGQYMPAPFALTDALNETEPANELMISGGAPTVVRFDLGRPASGRELQKIVVWWTLSDGARSGIHLKFAVHDWTTGEWRDVTEFVTLSWGGAADTVGRLVLTFPEGEVANFDALRMIDGRPLLKAAQTRWLELDVFTKDGK